MPRVGSSAFTSIEYNEFTRELYVTFTGGRSYIYYHVPPDLYQHFVGTSSKGQFFNAHIKDDTDDLKYRVEQIDGNRVLVKIRSVCGKKSASVRHDKINQVQEF